MGININNMELYLYFIFLLLLIIIFYYYQKSTIITEYFNYNCITYLFWTGGYDSTYRLCELLILKKKIVQPIYVSYNLDSENSSDTWVRRNRKNELETMNNIKNILFIRFPYVRELLKPTQFIENNFIDKDYDLKIH